MAKKKLTPADETAKRLKEAQAIGKSLGLEYENIADIQKMILANQVKTTGQLMQQLKLARAAQDVVEQEVEDEKRITAEKTRQNKLESIGEDISAKLLRTRESIKEAQKTIFTNTEKTYKSLKDSIKTRKQELSKLAAAGEISQDVAKASLDALNKEEERVDKLEGIQQQYQSQFDTLTALGGSLSKNFGSIGKIIDGSINKSMTAFADEMEASGDSSKALNAAMSGFGGSITSGLTKMLGPLAIFTMLYEILSDVTKQANAFAEATGVTFSQARGIVDQARAAGSTYDIQLATSKEILAVQQETISEFGNMAMLTTDVAANVAEMGKAFGYGSKQAALVNNQFISMGMSGEEAANTQRELAANALKAGVNVGTVMKDITANAKQASKYFGGNVKALTAAAEQAAKLGISLKDMTSIADKLLDIESSLQNQFELQAMTGKQINLDKARELALEGKIAEASQAVYEQIGGIAEFEKMRPLERRKLAEMMGMEVHELEKSLAIQEQMKDLTEDEMAAAMNLGLSAAEIRDMDAEQLQDKLAQQQSLEKTNQALAAAKDQIASGLLPIAQAFADVLASIAPVLKFLGDLVWVITWPFVKLVELAQTFGDYLSSFLPKWDELGAVGKTIVGIIKALAIGAVIWGAWAGLGWIPFVGPALAIGAAAAGISLVNSIVKTGDLAMGAGGGPIVANPREGTIFQGTANDEVAMGPGVIDAAQSSGGTTVVQQSGGIDNSLLQTMINELQAIKATLATPVPVQIGDRVITEIGTQLAVNKTYRTGVGGR
jgi:hypothetical protein